MRKHGLKLKISFSKLVSLFYASFPLLSSYRSVVSKRIDIGTTSILLITLLIIFKEKRIKIRRRDIMYLPYYIIIFSLLNMLIFMPSFEIVYPDNITIILRVVKFCLILYLFFSLDMLKYTDIGQVLKYVELIIFINSIYVIIQQLYYQVSGSLLANPFIDFAINDAYQSENMLLSKFDIIRPSGFFLEPAHLSLYSYFFLCSILFDNDSKKNWLMIFLSSVGVILSGSGMGIVFLVFLFALYIYKNIIKNITTSLIVLIAIGISSYFLLKTNFLSVVLNRVLTSGVLYGGNALQARIGDGYNIFKELPIFNKLFGTGYGNIPVGIYLNGMTYMLNSIGFIGTLMFLTIILEKIIVCNINWIRIVALSYIGFLLISQLFNANSIVFYLGLLLLNPIGEIKHEE